LEASAPELEQKNGSRKPIVTRNAIIISLILIGILLTAHFFAFGYQNERIAFGQFVLVLVSLIVTQLEVRDKLYQGILPFDKAFGTAMMVVLMVTAIFSFFTLIFYLTIGTDVLAEMRTIAENSLREQGKTEEDIASRMTFTNRIFTPVGMFFMSLVGNMFFGTIAALIASLFTQRRA
jgi:Protein of unknown function (DUF4199)